MSTFIKTINYGQRKLKEADSSKRSEPDPRDIQIAVPTNSPKGNALTIIAGRNRTGKSHLLRHAEMALGAYNENLGKQDFQSGQGACSSNVWVRPMDPTQKFGTCFLLNNVADVIGKFAGFGVAANEEKKGQFHKILCSVKEAFLSHQILNAESLEETRQQSRDSFAASWSDKRKRTGLLGKLDPQKIYRADATQCAAVSAFETITAAHLYLRYNDRIESIEPVLRYGTNEAFSFGGHAGGWSQGQKVAFVLLLIVEYYRPDILLIDELENYLHPEYISKVCEFIKARIPQTVVVTHHPHLIFSAFADRVWFLDVDAKPESPPFIDVFPDQQTTDRPPPRRKAVLLDSDYERIAAAYSLFDGYDHQLLNLASALQDQVTIGLLKSIESALTLGVAEAGQTMRPDTQSRELSDAISALSKSMGSPPLKILDYGAGRGRTLKEVIKTSLFRNRDVVWSFFEPNPAHISDLERGMGDVAGAAGSIFSTLDQMTPGSFDIVVVANVLHECSPRQIASALDSCRRMLCPTGKLLIAELYPLLSAERFGISYSSDDMHLILKECRYAAFSIPMPIRSGVATAYTTIATPLPGETDLDKCARGIRDVVWGAIKTRTLFEYASSLEIANARNTVKLASQLHVIASIEAYDAGLWPEG
ncbi:MAG: AAA family ATPase [Rhodocyclaceae bacterium]|nr:AAA family ATPase [Rhodocyclaceae bacterium]